jgi:hypothetical protein
VTSQVLVASPLAHIELDEQQGIVTLVRTEMPVELPLLEHATTTLADALPLSRRAHLALLFDMRKAPMSKPELEGRLFEFANAMQRGFLASATVIATAIGNLQVNRIRREGKVLPGYLSSDFAEARAHLEKVVREHRASRAGSRKHT